MNYAKKQEDKLKSKRVKLLNEATKFDQWENPALVNNFSADQIKKLIQNDKNTAIQMILPKEQQDIDDLKLLSAYLTESLLAELERVKT